MTKFAEINEPRIAKIMAMLDTIDTSAKSNRCEDDLTDLLQPLVNRLGGRPAPVEDGGDESPSAALQPMSRERLDYSIACSKADRAIRACEKVRDELVELKNAIPS